VAVTATGWASARSIDDVLERMQSIDRALPAADGVATFNRMYFQVTRLVDVAIEQGRFGGGPFLERLDVHFANLFFQAYADDLEGREVNGAWAPLFDNRVRPRTHPVQFALAGMNAHICHDLPSAVVLACRELAVEPVDGGPEHTDYSTTNSVLEEAKDEIKGWFSTGVVANLDSAGGRVDDAFALFGIHVARAGAWQVAQTLWDLADNPRLDRMLRVNLAHVVGLTGRGILI
jgi:hypothetical protein